MNFLKFLFLAAICCITSYLSANEPVYQTLSALEGVKQPVQSLNGAWQFRFAPTGKWETVQVPGELAMQGYAIEHDKPYTYRKTVTVPADYAGKRVILRFDGVYSYARLTVNGKFVRDHHGGFTRWETDVTGFVKTGGKNEIQVEITDCMDEVSYASGYAHHPIGGILRDVTLFALPETHLFDFYVETLLDTLYRDAQLKIGYSAANVDKDTEIVYSLCNDDGEKVSHSSEIKKNGAYVDRIEVKNPLKWDAEHPNLYTLSVSLRQKGKQTGQFTCQVGFREVKVVGERMLVNGRPVKLRGANRLDIHPTLGRTTTSELDSLDVMLFKEANMNFVRLSVLPPSEKFVELCDRYGIYVEYESAVCFVHPGRHPNYPPGNTQDDPAFTARYLSQWKELIKTFRPHASVVIWSIANESFYGSNFQQCWDWVKATDTTRPVLFSYPGTQKEGNKIYDMLSIHYPAVDGSMIQATGQPLAIVRFQTHEDIPVIFDEWASGMCHPFQTLRNDPNIREFWGQTIDIMWRNLFEAPGGLGGAIWEYVDETFLLPVPKTGTLWWHDFSPSNRPDSVKGNCVGDGDWGIVDIWRRKKPEFWSTKKGYSPVKLMEEKVTDFTPGQPVLLPVYNRFDHTTLDEIKAFATYRNARKEIKLPPVQPHRKGLLEIAGDNWANGEKIIVEFLTNENQQIDIYHIVLGEEKIELPQPAYQGKLDIEETTGRVIVKGNGFEIPFCKETGLICDARSGGQVLIEKGPFLNMDVDMNVNRHRVLSEYRGVAQPYIVSDTDWKKTSFSFHQKDGHVQVTIAGTYEDIRMNIQVDITPEGKITFDYITGGEPYGYLRESGLKFYLSDDINHLQWKRKGYWSHYPANDFAGNEGEAPFYTDRQAPYGQPPTQPWHLDTHNYFYWLDAGAGCSKPLTQAAKGMKENIYVYTLSANEKRGFSVVSPEASVACRTNRLPNEQLVLYANNRWDYPEIAIASNDYYLGHYCKYIENSPCFGKITLMLK